MFDKLKNIEARYNELMSLVSDASVQADPSEYRTHSKALAEIQPLVEKFHEYREVSDEIEQAKEIADSNEAELRELAEQELVELRTRNDKLLGEIKVLLMPKDPNDERNVVLEIRAGTGRDEAG